MSKVNRNWKNTTSVHDKDGLHELKGAVDQLCVCVASHTRIRKWEIFGVDYVGDSRSGNT